MHDKIVTFGEVLLRWSKDGCRRLSQGRAFNGNYGGSEANTAVSLSLLGNRVEYVTCLPDNLIGRACREALQYYHLDLSHVVTGGERLGTYYFEASAGMRDSRVVYDRTDSSFYSIRPGMIDWDGVLEDAALFHCSGITCAISESARQATFEALETAKAKGVRISCDVNYRKNLWKYGADPHTVLHDLMQYSDFIFGDQNEWEIASGIPHIPFTATSADYQFDEDAYKRYFDALHRQFPHARQMLLAVRNQLASSHHTLSGLLCEEGKVYAAPVYDIQPVIDPMGVGDAYVAAFLHADRKWKGDTRRCLDFALAASALKNTVNGDFNLCSEEEIEAVRTGDFRMKDYG